MDAREDAAAGLGPRKLVNQGYIAPTADHAIRVQGGYSMKRHPALEDLSRDHHFVLRFCQRIRRAVAANAKEAQVGELVDEFLAFYRSDMMAHFQEEDGYVVPI